MITFTNMEAAGLLPYFFGTADPRPAAEQLDENYAHGGGWCPMGKWALIDWKRVGHAKAHYPGDPLYREVSRATLRSETLILFEGSWLAIVRHNGLFQLGRVD